MGIREKDVSSDQHQDNIKRDQPLLFQKIMSGGTIPAHEGHPLDTPPPWLDLDKFRRGQQFAQKYLVPVMIGNFFAMMGIFVWQPIFRVVLYTRNLETLKKSAKRNFLTMVYIKSWYEGDLWNPFDDSYKNMVKVQRLHTMAASVSNNKKEELKEVAADTSLESHIEAQCNSWLLIRRGLAKDTAYRPPIQRLPTPDNPLYVSQLDHVITVLGIIMPVLLSPEKLGIHGHTKADMEGFVHMWRVLSYHLGIQDEYNPCQGNVYMVQSLCQEMNDCVTYPAFQNLTKEEEYVMRVSVDSMLRRTKATSFLSFEVMMLFMAWCMNDVDVSEFYEVLLWHEKLRFWILKMFVYTFMRVPFILSFLNYLLRRQAAKYSVVRAYGQ